MEKNDLKAFVSFLDTRKVEFENLFGRTVRSDLVDNPVKQLNDILGAVGFRLIKASTVVVASQKIYRYKLDKGRCDVVEQVRSRRIEHRLVVEISNDVSHPPSSNPFSS